MNQQTSWWHSIVPWLGVLISGLMLWNNCLQYQLNESLGCLWVGVTTLLGQSGTIGMCLIPDVEYKYVNECKPKHPDVLNYVGPADKLRGYIQVRNTGNSPALSTVLSVHRCVSHRKPSNPPPYLECDDDRRAHEDMWKDGPRVLFHGEGDSTLDISGTFHLSQEEIDSIKRSDRYFYFVGVVGYDREANVDLSKTRYLTEFCIYYDPRGHGEKFGLYYCPQGNSAS